jgi:molybdate transport system regulatory protein
MANREVQGWRVRSKVWLEWDGKPLLGKGRSEILWAIEHTGSLKGASRVTGVPYRRIWAVVRDMESRLGRSLVETRRGGPDGGGAILTEEARQLLAHFGLLLEGIQEMVDFRFRCLTPFFRQGDMQVSPIPNLPKEGSP